VEHLEYSGKTDAFTASGDVGQSNQNLVMGEVRELIRTIQMLRKEKKCGLDEKIHLIVPDKYRSLEPEYLNIVKQQTLAHTIAWGENFSLSTG
jgi:hypothetical protein